MRPNAGEFGSDTFSELTGISCADHMNQVKAWVKEGEVPEDADHTVEDFDINEIKARLHFRIAADTRSEYHFQKAEEAAPSEAENLEGEPPKSPESIERIEERRRRALERGDGGEDQGHGLQALQPAIHEALP